MTKNKKILHTIMHSRFWISVLAILVILLVSSAVSLFIKREKVWKKVDSLEKEKVNLLERKAYIDKKNRDFEEGIGKEAILRDKFNVVKPGEEIIVFTDPVTDPNAVVHKPTFWSRVKSFFKHDK